MRRAKWVAATVALSSAAAIMLVAASGSRSASTATLPSGFQDTVVFSGFYAPTAVRFASDGRAFVAQKDGVIKEFDSLTDTTPTTVIDLRTDVDDYWDRGLLGLALDPNFPTTPYMYALESYDAAIGGTAPTWNDNCPSPPGPTTDGCVISGRLLRLTLSGNSVTSTKILIKDQWCQQHPSHSIGDLHFGADGALYVTGGDGASFNFVDYGQSGGSPGSPTPKNPCGDPPAGVGGNETPPTAEGGALRSQSMRRPPGEPVLLNGAILRVDPSTGDALPNNPAAANPDPNARRIVAYGFRNPFRFTIRPGSNDLWIGDVGWNDWEEIDRQPSPTTSVLNFGWPCYEGNNPQSGYQSAGLNLCTSLYNAGTATAPYFTYNHVAHVVTGDNCPTGSSSITALAFYTGTSNYPASFNNGLFFGDYARNCIWFMPVGSNGLPDPTRVQPFEVGAQGPVDLEIGPNGDVFYVDIATQTVREIKYAGGGNNPPTAVATASPTSGAAPLTVNFDGSGSSDPDAGDTISYSWDLNGDGTFGDSTAQKPSYTYTSAGTYNAVLKVTDSHAASTTSAPVTIVATAGGTSTFGTTTPGTLTDTATADLKEVSKFTVPQAGAVIKVTGYVSGLGAASGSQPVRAVMYADSGGNPGALLGVSNAVTITAGRAWGWVDFTFPTQIGVVQGTVWIGYIAGTTSDLTQLRYQTSAGDLRYNANSGGYAAGPSNPFGSAITVDLHYSIYATYVLAGGGTNNPPTALATGSPTSGVAPLTVSFDGSGSSDPDAGDTISYSWDLNGDGTFGDATVAKPSFTYSAAGTYSAVLKVTDNHGASTNSAPITVTVTSGATSTFGTTTPGTLTDTATADYKEVSKFTAPSAGSVSKVTGYLSGLGAVSGSQKIRAVIYADSSGNPGARLGISNEVTINANQAWGWVNFTFPSPVAIQAGTVWIGYIGGTTSDLIQIRYDAVANDLRYNANTYTSGASDPFGTSAIIGFHYSLYATYSPAGGNQPPVPTISSPSASLTWKVGDLITFSGSATDPQDGTLPASGLSWALLLHHCDPTGQTCHIHPLQTFAGVSSGSFNAPDHGYPSYLELTLTATDSQGTSTTTSVSLQPKVVNLTFASVPTGLQVVFDATTQASPYTLGAIIGSTHSISAPATQTQGTTTYTFSSWSDGGAATHNVTAPATATTYTATYTSSANRPPTALATASPTTGTAPLTVSFDGSASSDPDAGDTISYSWDLNGDGTFGDSTAQKPSYTYTSAGTYNAVLKVTDSHGASTTSAPVTIVATAGGGTNNPPTALATGSPTSGVAPLTVNFDGSGSSDPDAGDTISYSWDLNGDGTFGDATVARPSFTYTSAGTFSAALKVADNHGASTTSAPVTITVTSSGSSTFGTTTPGSSIDPAAANVKAVSKFTSPRVGNVVKVTAYVSGLGANNGTQKLKAVIYADSGGNPGARLGVSNEVVISAKKAWGWVDFTFSSPVAIQAGTVWIGFLSAAKNDLTQLRYDPVASDLRYNANSYGSGASDPFGSASTADFHYSIYATYG